MYEARGLLPDEQSVAAEYLRAEALTPERAFFTG
jgi:hypothetical protein